MIIFKTSIELQYTSPHCQTISKLVFKKYSPSLVMYSNHLVHPYASLISVMYTKNCAADFANHVKICSKFCANRIISATAITSHTDRLEYKVILYTAYYASRYFCASLCTRCLGNEHKKLFT